MPIVNLWSWAKALWLGGAADAIPDDALRRAKNIDPLLVNEVRSRYGSTKLIEHEAHSIVRFFDTYYYGVGTAFYKAALQIRTGLSGQRLTFVRANPVAGEDEAWLFAADANQLFKVSQDDQVHLWGIKAPDVMADGELLDDQDKRIASFDAADPGTDGNVWNTRGQIGTFDRYPDEQIKIINRAYRIEAREPNAIVGIGTVFATAKDLDHLDDSSDSSDQDYITLMVRIRDVDSVERIMLYFDDTAAGDFRESYFSAAVIPLRQGDISSDLPEKTLGGLKDLVEDDTDKDAITPREGFNIARTLGATTFPIADDTWTKLRVPKSAFTHFGHTVHEGGPGRGWSDIQSVNIMFKLSNRFVAAELDEEGDIPAGQGAFIWLDELRLEGGAGMVGTYKYQFTFKNSRTGSRSNPSTADPLIVRDVNRNRVFLSSIPQPTAGSEVDKVEIWRTIGNGERFFKIHENDVGDLDFTDDVSDFAGFHLPADETDETVMTDEELPTDNASPNFNFNFHQTFGPHAGRVWWLSSDAGTKGHLYYSPAGRVEAVAGFINVTGDDDPLLRIIEWNGTLYAVSEAKWFAVVGDDEPFAAREVWGCVGTLYKWSICATPRGICYEANDGPRIFDGARSSQIGIAQVLPLFRGESINGMGAWQGTVHAAYGRGEWIISDGAYALAYNVQEDRWRELTIGEGEDEDEEDPGEEPEPCVEDPIAGSEVPSFASCSGEEESCYEITGTYTVDPTGGPLGEPAIIYAGTTGSIKLTCECGFTSADAYASPRAGIDIRSLTNVVGELQFWDLDLHYEIYTDDTCTSLVSSGTLGVTGGTLVNNDTGWQCATISLPGVVAGQHLIMWWVVNGDGPPRATTKLANPWFSPTGANLC